MLLAVAVSLTALPAAANDTPAALKEKPKASSQVSLRDVAARAAAKTTLAPKTANSNTARREQNSGTQSTSFFKSRPGAIALAVMVFGAGYAIYSTSHDRITSPAKQ